MNFQYIVPKRPMTVIVVNALYDASKLIIVKIMLGVVFGSQQRIDLILLVYANEKKQAEALKLELEACSFNRTNTITVSTDLPSITDAEVFCVVTNLPNPNRIDFTAKESDNQFDALYLLLQLAHNFSKYTPPVEEEEDITKIKKHKLVVPAAPKKPIFMVDGLVAVDILYTFSKVIPRDSIFCPTGVTSVARTCLADYLKVFCSDINDVFVWAADDEALHVEIEKPILKYDTVDIFSPRCIWNMMGKEVLEQLKLDHTQFSVSWLKKEYIEKVVGVTSSNVYGPIYKSSEYASTLHAIWTGRNNGGKPYHYNMGIVSDGSIGTIKGLPFVVPIVFQDDNYTVSEKFAGTTYLRYVVQKINKRVQEHHRRLIPYCKKFLSDNIINQMFVRSGSSDDEDFDKLAVDPAAAMPDQTGIPPDQKSFTSLLSASSSFQN